MAKIRTYPITPPAGGDIVIGTDVSDSNATKNFSVTGLGEYIFDPANGLGDNFATYILDPDNNFISTELITYIATDIFNPTNNYITEQFIEYVLDPDNNPNGNVVTVTGSSAVSVAPTTGDVVVDLNDTTVTAGSYTNTNITVDAQGRITAASNGSTTGTGVDTLNTLNGGLTLIGANGIEVTDNGSNLITIGIDTDPDTNEFLPAQTIRVAIPNPQMLLLPTTPFTIVQGVPGQIIIPISAVFRLDFPQGQTNVPFDFAPTVPGSNTVAKVGAGGGVTYGLTIPSLNFNTDTRFQLLQATIDPAVANPTIAVGADLVFGFGNAAATVTQGNANAFIDVSYRFSYV